MVSRLPIRVVVLPNGNPGGENFDEVGRLGEGIVEEMGKSEEGRSSTGDSTIAWLIKGVEVLR
jgi:hypothetical protein